MILILMPVSGAILGVSLGINLFFLLWRSRLFQMLAAIIHWTIGGTIFCLLLIFGANWLLGGFGVVVGVMIAGAGLAAAIGEQFGKGQPNKRQLTIRGAIIGLVSGFIVGLVVQFALGSLWAILIIALYAGNLAAFSGVYDELRGGE